METAILVIGVTLLVIETVLPFIPEHIVPANGIVHGLVKALRQVFPAPQK